jgi:glucoamylase
MKFPLSLFGLLFAQVALGQVLLEAPRDGASDRGNWASGVKEIFGTAYEAYDSRLKYSDLSSTAPLSKVWFTGSDKLLSEIYWPTLDAAQTRDTELLVSDGKSFLWNERAESSARVEWISKGVPGFHIIHIDSQKRFQIDKWIVTDPDRDAVIVKIKFTRFVDGLRLFVMHKPACHNTPMGDSARVETLMKQKALVAWELDHAQALIADSDFTKASAYFIGPHDGYTDLAANFEVDHEYQSATNGNVGLLAEFAFPRAAGISETHLILGFAPSTDKALEVARESLAAGADKQFQKYLREWPEYLRTLTDLSPESEDNGALFWSSVALIKSMEDKSYEGAFVAAPVIPWGVHRLDWADALKDNRSSQTGGYHLVWPRDLYQMATTLMAVGDFQGARAALNRLRSVQFGPASGNWEFGARKRSRDGSFPQNFWIDGTPYWDSLQLDEVAMPVILAYRLWRESQIEVAPYWNMVHRAADFIADFGPWSAQERWEESVGLSPSTIAAEISALWTAAEMAKAMNDPLRAERYASLARSWSSKPGDNIEAWTFTTTGSLGNGKYFLRIWDPESVREQRNIMDGGFLELVRLGVRSALAPSLLESLPEYDETLRTNVPNFGPGFKRYIGDRYNQDEKTGKPSDGMLWPLLTGERGHYEIEKSRAQSMGAQPNRQASTPFVLAMEAFATPTHMLPEQVWDAGDARGQPTGAATPLGWAHGEYIKLLRSQRDGKIFDRIPLVEERSQSF